MRPRDVYWLGCRASVSVGLQADLNFFRDHFNGTPLLSKWKAPHLEVLGKSKPLKDFISFELKAPTISERAMRCLSPVIGRYCEFLPLIILKGVQYYAINTIFISDCIDLNKSDVVRSPSDGRILVINTFAFIENRIPDVPIFTIQPPGPVFVRQGFVDCVKQNLLTNAIFMDPAVNQLPLIVDGVDRNIVPYVPL